MNTNTKKNKLIVDIFSIAIPLAVALLIGIRTKIDLGAWTKTLPTVVACINAATAMLLVMALIFIKKNKIILHRKTMLLAISLGAMFLVCYVTYHISNPSTAYGGTGFMKIIYYFLLISHIILSIGVVRLVLLALYYALEADFAKHVKIVKWAYPIWLYVSVTGVIIFILISPFYTL